MQIFATLLLMGAAAGMQMTWAKGWITAFHNSATDPVHVVVLSDSTAHVDQTNGIGYGPNQRLDLWPNQLQIALARTAPGGSHGTGLLTLEANAGRYDTDVWQLSGPYAYSAEIGPFQSARDEGGHIPANGGTVRLPPHEKASLLSQHGDTLWIYWAACPDSSAFTVDVDNIPKGVFGRDHSSTCVAVRTRVFQGPLGDHTVTINAGDGNAYLYAAEWTEGDTGVAVDNLAIGGATTVFFDSSAKLAYLHTIPNVGLLIIALGINDFAHAVPLSTYQSNLSTIILDVKKNSPNTSILVVSQYPVLSDDARSSLGLSQAQYWNIAQQVASKYKVGYLSLSKTWGSFSALNNRGILTSDRVHPSDKGGEQIALEIQRAIFRQP